HTIIGLAAGHGHSVILSADGTVFTFGGGAAPLGHGSTEWLSVPTPIEHANIEGITISQVAAGKYHTILLSHDGSVYTFGWIASYMGHGDVQDVSVPTLIQHE